LVIQIAHADRKTFGAKVIFAGIELVWIPPMRSMGSRRLAMPTLTIRYTVKMSLIAASPLTRQPALPSRPVARLCNSGHTAEQGEPAAHGSGTEETSIPRRCKRLESW
jgi:hypothetical protein